MRATRFRGERDDAALLRLLDELRCSWVLTFDQHREPEVWAAVYTTLSDGTGRLLRIRPLRPGRGNNLIAHLARYLVSAYEQWSPHLENPRIRLIDLGRGNRAAAGVTERIRGPTAFSAYTSAEVARLMQQQLGYGGGPRLNQRDDTLRGPRRPR